MACSASRKAEVGVWAEFGGKECGDEGGQRRGEARRRKPSGGGVFGITALLIPALTSSLRAGLFLLLPRLRERPGVHMKPLGGHQVPLGF
ncbi:hypothetical protein PDJAM_G00135090 [Pangasius djambal]|uniref:Uncharacterized protein n=1 Tax=Pangasius djambal TaxID=1691987 RepID=A0ACC5ZDF5_9TELE|nr:hypothetical protein [Pangasius djambal]